MKQNLTELVFILDRSGSMGGLENDTIGGFNAMLEKQKKAEGEAVVTTVLFDDRYELLHDRIDLRAVAPITAGEYFVRGCTALLDAMGKTIEKIAAAQQRTAPDYRAKNVLFVVTTDGMENASREYSFARIKELVERQKREFGWEFLFLGANIDAIDTAGRMGISADRAANYCPDGAGTQLNYEVVAAAACEMRAEGVMPPRWKARIDADYAKRKGK